MLLCAVGELKRRIEVVRGRALGKGRVCRKKEGDTAGGQLCAEGAMYPSHMLQ